MRTVYLSYRYINVCYNIKFYISIWTFKHVKWFSYYLTLQFERCFPFVIPYLCNSYVLYIMWIIICSHWHIVRCLWQIKCLWIVPPLINFHSYLYILLKMHLADQTEYSLHNHWWLSDNTLTSTVCYRVKVKTLSVFRGKVSFQ